MRRLRLPQGHSRDSKVLLQGGNKGIGDRIGARLVVRGGRRLYLYWNPTCRSCCPAPLAESKGSKQPRYPKSGCADAWARSRRFPRREVAGVGKKLGTRACDPIATFGVTSQ